MQQSWEFYLKMDFLGIEEEKGVEIHRGSELRGLKILTAQE